MQKNSFGHLSEHFGLYHSIHSKSGNQESGKLLTLVFILLMRGKRMKQGRVQFLKNNITPYHSTL